MRKAAVLIATMALLVLEVRATDQFGRCCYFDVTGAPACNLTTQVECATLQGSWTAGLTCEEPCSGQSCVGCSRTDVAENEPCPAFPDTVNGGCDTQPIRFSTIECGQAVCGQSFRTAGGTVPSFFDSDWYIITLTEPTFVTLCLKAEYVAALEIFRAGAAAPCPGEPLDYAETDSCDTTCIRRCLTPGTYLFATYPVAGQAFECRDYRFSLECGPCPEPCVVECPTSAIPEDEACPPTNLEFDANGGCLKPPYLFHSIECGMSLCGQSWYVPGAGGLFGVDVDAYQVTVLDTTRLRFCVVAEFNPAVALIPHDDSCRILTILDTAFGRACDTLCVEACVPPGTYDLYVLPLPDDNAPFLCGTYYAHLSCEPCEMPCQGTPGVWFDSPDIPQCQCVQLCPGQTFPIRICGPAANPFQPPIVTVTPGCSTPDLAVGHCSEVCDPIPSTAFIYDPQGWVWDPASQCWVNVLVSYAAGCACVCLEDFLAVELASFSAVESDGSVMLHWQTASERESDHFELNRNGQLVAANIPATNNASGSSYQWTDRAVVNGETYRYELIAVDMSGNRVVLGATEATPRAGSTEVISEYALRQNYPNPFNPRTSISFDLVESGRVSLTVFNMAGQEVATVVDGPLAAGRHAVTFDASALPSGMYLYRLSVNGFSAARKMMLVK